MVEDTEKLAGQRQRTSQKMDRARGREVGDQPQRKMGQALGFGGENKLWVGLVLRFSTLVLIADHFLAEDRGKNGEEKKLSQFSHGILTSQRFLGEGKVTELAHNFQGLVGLKAEVCSAPILSPNSRSRLLRFPKH